MIFTNTENLTAAEIIKNDTYIELLVIYEILCSQYTEHSCLDNLAIRQLYHEKKAIYYMLKRRSRSLKKLLESYDTLSSITLETDRELYKKGVRELAEIYRRIGNG